MIGDSEPFHEVQRLIARISRYEAPVLIEGETGTGKELAARAIHYGGPRRDGPFVPVNCGALPDSLVESELFGHRRGAFTDARDDRPGLVALAHGGTLFLDEIDALTPKAQVTLLRFLQDQQYRPVGGRREEQADVRLVAASNRSLDALAEADRFRGDLLYRIKLMRLTLPTLRERKGDIELLARHFVDLGVRRFECPRRPLSSGTLEWFEQYSWPGNIRELEHVVYQGLLLGDGPELEIPKPPGFAATTLSSAQPYRRAKELALVTFEHAYLARLIAQANGNVSVAARIAGTERRYLGRLLKKHRLLNGTPT